jgi:PAS domain S-box-containing protein
MNPTKIYNILVIEDNHGDYTIVNWLLNEKLSNPHVKNVDTFKKAVDILTNIEIIFDVILLDLSLPDKQSEDLVTEILKLAGNCPVIILTGVNNVHFSIDAIAKGVADYLVKDGLTATSLYKSISYAMERKKHIAELSASKKNYSDLFQLNPLPTCLYENDTQKVIYINQAASNLFGYSYEDFLNMSLLSLVPPENLAAVAEYIKLQNRQLNSTYVSEFKILKKNGELIDVQAFSTPLIYNNQKATMVLVVDITEKKLNDQKNTQATIIQTQEKERYEIGAELHDNVGQILFASQMTFKMLKNGLSDNHLSLYEQGSDYILSAAQEIRGLSHRLAPVFFEDTTLEEAINGLINSIDIINKFKIKLQLDDNFKQFPCKQEFLLTLYRILQEQFTNISKYSYANTVEVIGYINNETLVMTIADNGVGFDVAEIKTGIGLANIKRRIEAFGGNFTINASIGNGCALKVEAPLEQIV